MSDNIKRTVSQISHMDYKQEPSSSSIFKKKKKMKKKMSIFITNHDSESASASASSELEFCSSGDNLNCATASSPASSLNSDGEILSGGGGSFSCCSGNVVVDSKTTTKMKKKTKSDMEVKSFKIQESKPSDIKLFSDKLLNEYSGDSEESLTVRVTSSPPPAVANKVPPVEEIEEFFAKAEKYEQERFAKKYNFDIAKDVALEGRYEWVRLK